MKVPNPFRVSAVSGVELGADALPVATSTATAPPMPGSGSSKWWIIGGLIGVGALAFVLSARSIGKKGYRGNRKRRRRKR